MASTNKTENYELNQWVGTDKPQRVDFNEDNRIVDELLHNHFTDMSMHTTALDKMQNASYSYFGDGSQTQVLEMPFEPDAVIVMPANHTPVSISGTAVKWYAAAAVKGLRTGSIIIDGSNVTVKQREVTQTDRQVPALNEDGELYIIIALRSDYGAEEEEE